MAAVALHLYMARLRQVSRDAMNQSH
jgi:hypothetical protein